jgi:hypothetical protein
MSGTELSLYFITATSGDGDNLDLFTRASDPTSALAFLSGYYNVALQDLHDVKVFCVPADCTSAGPLPWHTVVQEQQPLTTAPALQRTIPLGFLVREFDTIMAALRVYQRYLECDLGKDPQFDSFVAMIAEDHGPALEPHDIDLLCQKINC